MSLVLMAAMWGLVGAGLIPSSSAKKAAAVCMLQSLRPRSWSVSMSTMSVISAVCGWDVLCRSLIRCCLICWGL